MTKHYRNLIGRITSDEVMLEAYRLTSRGKALNSQRLAFKEFDVLNLAELATEMRRGEYKPGEPNVFQIFDPKPRTITALPFRDRVAQQAVGIVIEPIFSAAMLPRSFACQKGKGTHAGVRALQSDLRRLTAGGRQLYFLKTDFSKYFASIQLPVLWRLIEKKISCADTLRLIAAMVPREGIGLPIGSLTSQIFANLYTGATLDRFLQQECGESYWYRYMDDLVVLGADPEYLRRLKSAIERYSAEHLGLRFSKWSIASTARGINFLGFRVWPSHKLLRRDSVVRAKRKVAAFRAAGDLSGLEKFVGAWGGHAAHADTGNLLRLLGLTVPSR